MCSARSSAAALAAAALCMILPASAPAQQAATGRPVETPPPKLVVTRASDAAPCPDAAAIAATLEKTMGRSPVVDITEGAGEGFDVFIGKESDGFIAIVRPRGDPSAERRLSDPAANCEGLAEALTLTLTVLLDRDQPRTAEGPGPGDKPPPSPAPRPDRRQPPKRAEKSNFSLDAHAGAMATFGMIDSLAPAFFAEIENQPIDWFGAALGVLFLPPQSQTNGGPGSVDVSVIAVPVRGCWYPWTRPVRVGACAVVAPGLLVAEGLGFDEQGRAQSFWFDLGAMAVVRGRWFGPLGWSARAGMWAPLRRETVKVCFEGATEPGSCEDGGSGARTETYYETAPVAGSIGASLYATIF